MSINRGLAAFALVISLLSGPAHAQMQTAHILRSQIEAMFADMKAHTPWDLNGELLWGYYFTSTNKADLERASKLLTDGGYRFVEIRLLKKEEPDAPNVWQLHVERVEHHTPDSLFARNEELYAFAARLGLGSYDGMDVGPAK